MVYIYNITTLNNTIKVMKKYLLIVCVFMYSLNSFSQGFCETSSYSPNYNLLVNTFRQADFTSHYFCVTIYVHVLRRDNGTGGQSSANVNSALGYLDSAFNPRGISFDWNGIINYIDDTSLYDAPSGVMNSLPSDHTNGVDIYLGDDSVGHPVDGNGYGTTEGVGYSSKLMVTGFFLGTNLVRSPILSHEMGHVFNLWHTRHGTVTEDFLADPYQCPELVNGSNAATCGDYIVDTPADPDIAFNVNPITCVWTGTSPPDANGDAYVPDIDNIMARSHPDCMDYFTPEQRNRMGTALMMVSHLQSVSKYTFTWGDDPCEEITSLNYYPNSANNELNLDLTDKPANTYSYTLYDSTGVVSLSGQSTNVLETIDTSGLQEGIYFLHFNENGVVIIKQIIVDH
jgi:hypothetical protein